MSIFGKSSTPKRQSALFEDRVAELMRLGLTQDQAVEQTWEEMPGEENKGNHEL